jgi:hypothetical protein
VSRILCLFALLLAAVAPARAQPPRGVETLEQNFAKPPDGARIMMRWWWFGPAVTKPGLEREMRLMKAGGIGGFEVQPVYPVTLDDAKLGIRTLPYLSDEFIDALRFTAGKARELGLRFDLTVGSGWPYGGATVPISQASARLKLDRVRFDGASRRIPLPAAGAGEQFLGAFLAPAGNTLPVTGFTELKDIRDGAVWLPANLEAPAEILFYTASRTGMQVKRAAVGAEGCVLDHYDEPSVRAYLASVGDRLMQAFGPRPPYAVFCDSLEVYNADWTPAFLTEFQKRRGYDLRPWLPALNLDAGPRALEIRRDASLTMTELLEERFLSPLQAWAKRNKTLLRIQNYGTPPATISSSAGIDLLEGEGHEWKTLWAGRWASSAAHLYGRNVVSSETWTWLHSPVFAATPLDLKAEADVHFLQGINQLIGHGWPYTADGVEYPGWRFYAAGVYNEKNPWWNVMPDLALYLQRLSHLLRQGAPANDVAFYLPVDDARTRLVAGRTDLMRELVPRLGPNVVARVLESGLNFDFIDDGVVASLGKVENGALVMGANRYRVVLLPAVERMPLATARKLEEFVRAGGTLVATRRTPSLVPGFQAAAAELAAIVKRLFEGPTPAARLVADENQGLADALTARLRPDLSLSPPAPEVGFIRRSTPDAEIYFVANTGAHPQRVQATFRVAGRQAELWDPFTGKATPLASAARPAGGSAVALELAPHGSRVVVFTRRQLPAPAAAPAAQPPAPLELSSGWRLTVGNQASVELAAPRSWTEQEATRYFSGVATYEKTVTLPAGFLQPGLRVSLDFGEAKPFVGPERRGPGMRAGVDAPVRDAAVVTINGRRAGSLWCPPYALDVTGYLRSGENTIRVEVANTALNHMAGRKLPDYRLLNLRYGTRFEPQDMERVTAQPSGLLGAIRLVAAGN